MADDPRAALVALANRVGANPLDLATVMSFESGFSPSIRGGSGNRHIGLIQFGIPEQKAYGAHQGQSFVEQLPAVERYLTDRGFKPGMGLLDLYSTVNAGRPGLAHRSDARNGGTPGTVEDKVNDQMAGHRRKAEAFLGGSYTPPAATMTLPAQAGGRVAPARLGLSGAEAAAASSPVMAMPNAPQPSPPATQPDPNTITAADLMKMLAAPAQVASQTMPPAASQAPPIQPLDPAPPPPTFDAARFFALLQQRR